ncbi:carbohydrate ABC transporter permease [Microbacterium sp. XT11]|uniref:carbohydrate ABC transporter permease n=1 Tax=Microbacterium sp. XT11 TaxID=367477 RepID=UPI0009F8CD82|nr:sugar ABC transporter permease [Microbacterium sp. XT11]
MTSLKAPGVGQAARAGRPLPDARADRILGLTFVAPQVLGIVLLGIIPFGFVVWYSFHDWNVFLGSFEFIGLDNYVRMFTDKTVAQSLQATGIFALGLVVTNVAVALALASLLNQRLRGTVVFRSIFFSPVVVSIVAWVIIWDFLLASNGGINGVLSMFGIQGPNWLAEPGWAMAALVIVQVSKGVGMNMILFLAALQGVPSELKESARLDGASPWRTYRSITLPLITPTLLMVLIITTISAFDVFAPVQLLTGGGPGNSTLVFSYYIYQTAFGQQQFGYGATLGVLLFVITLAITALQWKVRRTWVHDEV